MCWSSSSTPLPTIRMETRFVFRSKASPPFQIQEKSINWSWYFIKAILEHCNSHYAFDKLLNCQPLLLCCLCIKKERDDDLCSCLFTTCSTRSLLRWIEVITLKGYMNSTVLQWYENENPCCSNMLFSIPFSIPLCFTEESKSGLMGKWWKRFLVELSL